MIFADIPGGSAIFVDTNTLVYHFAPDPVFLAACDALLIRIKRQEIEGFTSTHVIGEMAHRLMTIEATRSHGLPGAGIAQRLRKTQESSRVWSCFGKRFRTCRD